MVSLPGSNPSESTSLRINAVYFSARRTLLTAVATLSPFEHLISCPLASNSFISTYRSRANEPVGLRGEARSLGYGCAYVRRGGHARDPEGLERGTALIAKVVLMLISVVIDNYNYAAFLRPCVDSCLRQEYQNMEIIVVDDGSNDGSREIIESYGTRVNSIFNSNGGQGSALNSGFIFSSGEVLIFLDSDDVLLPSCLLNISKLWRPEFSKVHFNLKMIDDRGNSLNENYCSKPLPRGDLKPSILNSGNYVSTPTSGNAFSRSYLNKVMPIPETDWRRSADVYLINLAPLFGEIGAIDEPQGCYRTHQRNVSSHIVQGRFNIEKCHFGIEREIKTEALIATFASRLGYNVTRGALTNSYSHLQLKMIHDKFAKHFDKPRYGSPYTSFAQMSRRVVFFKGSDLIKMLCIHCYMFVILLAQGRWAERLMVLGYLKGAVISGRIVQGAPPKIEKTHDLFKQVEE
jgi:glycosyltransferase involved in cell wall biosynthesis